jgi:uncharacterized integral membrane protein
MKLIEDRNRPLFVFHRAHIKIFIIGVALIFIFFAIFLIIAIKNWQLNYSSFFFRNLKKHIFITILSGFHVGILASGILLILISFFKMPLEVYSYNDRFKISMFLQKKKIIENNKISSITTKIFYLDNDNLFQKFYKKECRVYFNNPIHNFYLCYPVYGYFDDVEITLNKKKEDLSTRCIADKESVISLVKIFKKNYSLNIPFLPEQVDK